MNHENGEYSSQTILNVYWVFPASSVTGDLDRIRTILTGLVAEMRSSGLHEDAIPTAAAANQAFNVIVKGNKRSSVTINTGHVVGENAMAIDAQT